MKELEDMCLSEAFDSTSSSKFSFSSVSKSSEELPETDSEEDDSEWKIFTKCRKSGNRACDAAIELLKSLKLETEILEKSMLFYQKTIESIPLKRIKLKNAIMCACVFVAFSLHKDFREEKSLMDHFGIDKIKYTRGLKLVKTVVAATREVKNSVDNSMFKAMRDLNILNDTKNIKDYIEKHQANFVYDKLRISTRLVKFALMYCWLLENKEQVINIRDFSTVCEIAPRPILRLLFKNSQVLAENINAKCEKICHTFEKNYNLKINNANILGRTNYINIIRNLY